MKIREIFKHICFRLILSFTRQARKLSLLVKVLVILIIITYSRNSYSQEDTMKYEVLTGPHYTEETYKSQQYLEMEKLWKWDNQLYMIINKKPNFKNYLYEDAKNIYLSKKERDKLSLIDSLIHKTDSPSIEEIFPFTKNEQNPIFKRFVIYSIEVLKDTNSYSILENYLFESNDFVKLDAAKVISKLHDDKNSSFQIVNNIWYNGNLKKKIYAIIILKELNNVKSIELLKKITNSRNEYYKVSSLIALSQLGYYSYVFPKFKEVLKFTYEKEVVIGSLMGISYLPQKERVKLLNVTNLSISNDYITRLKNKILDYD